MNKGFTIIEVLVVLGVMAILSSILLLYSRGSETQIVLFKDHAKVVNVVLRAKSLAIQTFAETTAGVCGYGVHFEFPRNYILFKDLAENCSQSDQQYSGSNEDFEVNQLDERLKFQDTGAPAGAFTDVIFIPPDPQIKFLPIVGSNLRSIGVIIEAQPERLMKISINNAGQVTTQ